MTFINKLLTYLGFCPSKESAQRFGVRNNTISLKQGVIGVVFIFILLVGANYIFASAVTVDTSRLFSNIVLGLILVIVMVGGQIIVARKYEYGLWTLAREAFQHNFILVFIIGAPWPGKPHNYGFWFISPTDGWVEIITEVLAISLMITAVEVMGARAYFRWEKDQRRE